MFRPSTDLQHPLITMDQLASDWRSHLGCEIAVSGSYLVEILDEHLGDNPLSDDATDEEWMNFVKDDALILSDGLEQFTVEVRLPERIEHMFIWAGVDRFRHKRYAGTAIAQGTFERGSGRSECKFEMVDVTFLEVLNEDTARKPSVIWPKKKRSSAAWRRRYNRS